MQPDIRETINRGTMSPVQVMAIAICIVLNMLDGFDVLAMAFTASHISTDWHLTGKEVGVLLSAGLFGMAAGSLFLAPWADRIGRRPLILICLGTISAGMLCSALAQNVPQLAALRAVTGLGIGGMLASINVITGEYASDKWRSTAIVLQATGYPVGATIGGAIAGVLLAHYGWRSVFVFGGLVTLAMVPVVLARLPESLDFLIARRPEGALDKLNRLLARMGRPAVAALPAHEATQAREAGDVRSLFHGGLAMQTLMIWMSFFLVMFTFYFVLSWTPKLLVAAGMSAQQGITGGVLLNVGGIVGGTAFAFLSARIGLRPLLWSCFILTALTMVAFGLYAGTLAAALALAVVIGAGIFGCMVGLYAYAPILYPAQTRTTGMGWSIGMGRFGAVLAPLVAGSLLDAGWPSAHLYYVFAIPLLVAIASVGLLGRLTSAVGRPIRVGAH